MADATITIDATNDRLTVTPNVCSVKAKGTVQWQIVNLAQGRRVDVEFETQNGVCGPFKHSGTGKPHNPTRGWFGTHSGQSLNLDSDAGDQAAGTMWKYDVVLTDCSSGRELDCEDPWIRWE